MSERNYESLYWEAQSHIGELEGDNAELKRDNDKVLELIRRYKQAGIIDQLDALLTAEKQ